MSECACVCVCGRVCGCVWVCVGVYGCVGVCGWVGVWVCGCFLLGSAIMASYSYLLDLLPQRFDEA